jgi:diguanylate cyclase (GGDEF)-like protein
LSIRTGTAAIVTVTMLVLTVVLLVAVRGIIDSGFAQLERRDTDKSVRLSLNWVASQAAPLAATAVSYGNWDDTYRFVIDRNAAYVAANLQDVELASLHIDFMVFLDARGSVVYAKAIDQQSETARPMPAGLTAFLGRRPAELRFTAPNATVAGIIGLPEGPAILGAAPIVTSQGKGPIRGTMLIGYFLRGKDVDALAKATGLVVNWFSLAAPRLPADVLFARDHLRPSGGTLVEPVDAETVAGYGQLVDLRGEPAVVLKVALDRTIVAKGHTVLTYMVVGLLLFIAVSIAVLVVVLDSSVLARLAHLNEQVSQIEASEQTDVRLPAKGRDEIAQLAVGINAMLNALERSREKLLELATHDPLTHLHNRRWFEDELGRELAEHDRVGLGGALLWFDLDNFKLVNDTYGHRTGDEVLVRFAEALSDETRLYSSLARLGGDEFAMLIPGADEAEAVHAADRLLGMLLARTFAIEGRNVGLSASIGVAVFPQDGQTVETLLARADAAMYRAKSSGCGRVMSFSSQAVR